MISSVGEKARAIEQRRADDKLLVHALDLADRGQFVDLESLRRRYEADAAEEGRTVGCVGVVGLLSRLFGNRQRVALDEPGDKASTAASKLASVFHKTSAADKLAAALESVQSRKSELTTRVDEARAKATKLHKAGQRGQAIATMKRVKILEQQLQGVLATEVALEQQIEASESMSLNKEVSDALSSGLKKAKKGSKGLLSKAEAAMDGAEEMHDFNQELSQLLGGSVADTFDDDDLLAELETLSVQEPTTVAESAEEEATASDWQPISLPVPTKQPELGVGAA